MSKCSKPSITSAKQQYTKITFQPDLELFKMDKLDDDVVSVLHRRVYDLVGTVAGVKVSLNGTRLKAKGFKGYVEMFVKALREQSASGTDGEGESTAKPTIVHERINDRWDVAFAVSDGNGFNQVSFVNSIATTSGGTHVNYITDQLVTKVSEYMKKKNARSAAIRPAQIKNNMFVFVNSLIENPAFTSQTKEQLTTKVSAFGSKCVLPDTFLAKVLKTSIVDNMMDIATQNADKELKRQDGGKKRRITGYAKLQDANKAGTRESHKCTLILTEGDSAMALAISGLEVVGRDYFGCFPLRGKMLNVRDASHDQIMKNAEIQAIKQIMGLQHKKTYRSVDGLRYGSIMIMTDQDHDGSHIKGLIINFLESSFPGLLEIPGFLVEFITPIVKVSVMSGKRVSKVIPFYTMPQYEHWRETEGKTCVWKQKYYKGLGTSSAQEAREYFLQIAQHKKVFDKLVDEDKGLIELAFGKKKADARKDWLRTYKPGTHLDPTLETIPISEFINKELILFSIADNLRSIPNVMDGFKPGQRKIIYACFRRNLTSDIRVAQLAGYVSENTAYHHGEASLHQTIVGLAQDFVGSNNLYYLMPHGGFGTRHTGGKDASAPRYIHTMLNPLTRLVFNKSDDPLYKYVEDDESVVEPEWYAPVLPTILVNGAEGIGTGWSTNIPSFNPIDLVDNIRRLMNDEPVQPMCPWYRGWNGTIEQIAPDKFRISGAAEQVDDRTIEITELPVRMWTQTMREYLLDAIEKGWITDMTEEHAASLKFVITLSESQMQAVLKDDIMSKFKLQATMSLGNMVAFDSNGRLRKYDNVEEILREYYYVRLDLYQKRKDHMAGQFKNELEKISSQARFIKLIIDKKLTVSNRKKADLVEDLERLSFPKFGKDGVPHYSKDELEEEISVVLDEFEKEKEEDPEVAALAEDVVKPDLPTFDYLLNMPIYSLTRERYEKLLRQRDTKENELHELLKKSAKDLWNIDLDKFVQGWHDFEEEDRFQRTKNVFKKTDKKNAKRRAPAAKVAKTTKKAKIEPLENDLPKSLQASKPPSETVEDKKPVFGSGLSAGVFGSPVKKRKSEYERDADDLFADMSDLMDGFKKTTSAFGQKSDTEPAAKSKPSLFALDDDEDVEIFDGPEPIRSRSSSSRATPSTTEKPSKPPAKTTSRATKASAKPKAAPKAKSRTATPLSDDDDVAELISAPVEPRKRAARANTKKTYTASFSDEDDSIVQVADDDEDDDAEIDLDDEDDDDDFDDN